MTVWEVFFAFLRLGCTSFGGPVAHIGYFHAELVRRRGWIGDSAYANLVSLSQFLPGPASSKVGFLIGYERAGLGGAVAAWIAFTAPSALLLAGAALCLAGGPPSVRGAWLHGVEVAVLGVIAQAIWAMSARLCPDTSRAAIALASAAMILLAPGPGTQIAVLLAAGLAGLLLPPAEVAGDDAEAPRLPSRRLTAACWMAVAAGLVIPPLILQTVPLPMLALFASYFRVGAMVFGGGHVVLPMLQAEIVSPGGIDSAQLLAGYGLAQMVPGPLFSVAAWLGATLPATSTVVALGTALLALVAIFLPGLLIALGSLRLFHRMRALPQIRCVIAGLNAGVVGLLVAVCYDPIFTTAILARSDLAFALLSFTALVVMRWSSIVVVAGCTVLVYGWGTILNA